MSKLQLRSWEQKMKRDILKSGSVSIPLRDVEGFRSNAVIVLRHVTKQAGYDFDAGRFEIVGERAEWFADREGGKGVG